VPFWHAPSNSFQKIAATQSPGCPRGALNCIPGVSDKLCSSGRFRPWGARACKVSGKLRSSFLGNHGRNEVTAGTKKNRGMSAGWGRNTRPSKLAFGGPWADGGGGPGPVFPRQGPPDFQISGPPQFKSHFWGTPKSQTPPHHGAALFHSRGCKSEGKGDRQSEWHPRALCRKTPRHIPQENTLRYGAISWARGNGNPAITRVPGHAVVYPHTGPLGGGVKG